MKKLMLIVIMTFFLGVPALANDYGLPESAPWDRGDADSTYQHWQFSSVTSNAPESDPNANPYGEPTFEFEVPTNWGWNPAMPGPDGPNVTAWTLQTESGTGTIILHVPNNPETNLIKYIYLQMTSTKAPSSVTPVGGGGGGPYTGGTWSTGVPSWQEQNGWYTYNWGLTIEPNPEFEDIVITVPWGTSIDQIVVDSICITPEPVTMGLLAIGGLTLLTRNRRRRT